MQTTTIFTSSKTMKTKMLFMLFLAATACTAVHAQGAGSYTVKGMTGGNGNDGKAIYIRLVDRNEVIDSTIVSGGRFFFTGHVDTAAFCRIDIGYNVFANFILERGNITVDMNNHNSPSGTPLNDKMRALDAESRRRTLTGSDTTGLAERSDELFSRHGNDALGYYLLCCSDYFRMRNEADKKRIVDNLGPWLRSAGIVQNSIIPRIEARTATSEGCMFADVEGCHADGKPAALSDYIGRGRYVLMNMWAGWCRQCREETPYLAELYRRFSGKGLTVLGLFVWDGLENLPKAMDDEGITWPQIADTGNTAAKKYGVSGIPQIILFGPDGRIIARDLHGKEMVEKVEKIMTGQDK